MVETTGLFVIPEFLRVVVFMAVRFMAPVTLRLPG
jgi:hypothetical protein